MIITPSLKRGYYATGSAHAPPIYTGWALQYFPLALAGMEEAGYRPEPVPELFEIDTPTPVILLKKQAGKPVSVRMRAVLMEGGPIPEKTAKYTMSAPGEAEIISGNWNIQKPEHLELSAGEPDGVYRLTVRNASKLVIPAVAQTDVPEVLVFDPEEEVVLGNHNNQVWFFVPEETEQFYVQIPLAGGHYIRRISVWDPDGKRTWDLNYHSGFYKGEDPVKAVIRVKPQHTGKLWRITLPGRNVRFRMDPQIPPVYATARDRWFSPENPGKN